MSRAVRPSWTCAKCLFRQRTSRRSLTVAATATRPERVPSVDAVPRIHHSDRSAAHDDRLLRQIFDSRAVWKQFSQSSPLHVKTGLFKNDYLTSTNGFQDFALSTIAKCKTIVAKVLEISTAEGYRGIVRDLDRLSDLLCRVIDLCEFVRSTHPDPKYQKAAANAHALMFEYMNTLNTTTGLCEQLKKALGMPEIVESWTREEKMVAQILMKDFQQSAIDLPEDKRKRWVSLSNEISQLGYKFVDDMEPARSTLLLDSRKLKGMDPTILKHLIDRRGRVHFPTVGSATALALRQVEDENTRREIYIASRTASSRQVHTVEQFLGLRAELANLAGYPSYASMTLVDKMAQSPEAVMTFLSALTSQNAPRLRQELDSMLALKRAQYPDESFTRINAWDKDYYRARLSQTASSPSPIASRAPDFLPAFLSLGTVMQGLSRLFSRLYGVRFVPRETLPGEGWDPDVRRLDVVDEVDGHIAVLYCDLFARLGKNPHPAHFTVRCSREISESEMEEVGKRSTPYTQSPAQSTNDGMAVSYNPVTKTLHQLPTIALICDFATPANSHRPTLLSLHDLQTLFHEMGHAIHSILGRTSLQCISGTRCATDFAELPSVLMESFATDPNVLGLFARHYESDAPLPYHLVEERLREAKQGGAAEIEAQILMAVLDQVCHSSAVPATGVGGWDSTEAWHNVYKEWAVVPEAPGTSWQGFFGHLVGYGGVYYSYLLDRAIAKRVWQGVFRGGQESLDREKGERYKRAVLSAGGGRSGWECVGEVLGGEEGERLVKGGPEAMGVVGGWGV